MKTRPPVWNGIDVPYDSSLEELQQAVDGSGPSRWAAFVALAHHSDDSALKVLREKAASNDPDIRRIAVEAIGTHRRGFLLVDVVSRLLSDPFGPAVRSACHAAASHKMTECHALVLCLLTSTDENTVEAALAALKSLWRSEDFEIVFMVSRSSRSEIVRKRAACTLRAAASAENWRDLYEAWRSDLLPRHRIWACELAGAYGGPDEETELTRLRDDPDGHVRTHAVRALLAIGAPPRR